MAGRLENSEIADVFVEMADLTHIVGGDEHRIRAFRNAARVIENLPEDVKTSIGHNAFEKTPGIGPGTVHRVKQILRTGTTEDLQELRRRLPSGLRELLDVKGIGASTARRLWQHLKVQSLADLEAAIRSGELLKVPRMGQRTAEKLMKALEDHKLRIGRVPYVEAKRLGERMVAGLEGSPEVQRVRLAGSLRRGKATVGDLDVLVASDDGAKVSALFCTLPEVHEVLLRGDGRASVRLLNRQQCDLRVLPLENWGAGLHYFTGSQLHNIAVRARALRLRGLKISDRGVYLRDTDVLVHLGGTEEDIFAAAQLPFIEPELRENTGELEAAAAGRLPRLVTAGDLRGDLHMHTLASDGKGTVEQMAAAAIELGHQYIAITDHTQSLDVANGLDERRLLGQIRQICALEDRLGALRVAAGTEVDILADGSLDLELEVLQGLDWVVASVHSAFEMSGEQMTSRLIAAMESGVVDVIGHPTGRRLDQRGGSELDWERLFQSARQLGVAIEVNGNPYRMDLPDTGCRRAVEMGVKLAINTDAHAPGHLRYQEYGLVTARRGWVQPSDVVNTLPWAELADRRRDRFRTRGWRVPQLPAPAAPLAEERAAPVLEQHWPEPEAADPLDDQDLTARLSARPLEDRLRVRIEAWMRSGADAALERALGAGGANPLQAAFNLLMGG
jgi:DNA polymerase (family X)